MKPIVSVSEVDIFFDGIFSEPRLRHPEGLAIDGEGNVWCGEREVRYTVFGATVRR